MKHQGWVFGLFLGCVLVAEASCSSDYRSSRPEDDDDDGAGGSGSVTSTGSGEPSSSSSGAGGTGGTGGSGGMCLGEGQACDKECCEGLTCNAGVCSSCKPLDSACSLGSECCSNACEFGACVNACLPLGNDCFQSSDCCSGLCSGGTCQSGSCVTCAEYLTEPAGTLCPESQSLYDDYQFCVCTFCSDPCSAACEGGLPSPDCQSCASTFSQGGGPCSMQFAACANDI